MQTQHYVETSLAYQHAPLATLPVSTTKRPRVGDDVLYVLHDGVNKGQSRPAKVVRTWGMSAASMINLHIFLDAYDYPQNVTAGMLGHLIRTSVAHNEHCEPGTWHWIDEE